MQYSRLLCSIRHYSRVLCFFEKDKILNIVLEYCIIHYCCVLNEILFNICFNKEIFIIINFEYLYTCISDRCV